MLPRLPSPVRRAPARGAPRNIQCFVLYRDRAARASRTMMAQDAAAEHPDNLSPK